MIEPAVEDAGSCGGPTVEQIGAAQSNSPEDLRVRVAAELEQKLRMARWCAKVTQPVHESPEEHAAFWAEAERLQITMLGAIWPAKVR